METVERIFHSVEEENRKTKNLVKKQSAFVFNDDEEHNNRLIDTINECKEMIGDVNEVYLRLFGLLEGIYEVNDSDIDESDRAFLSKLIKGLNEINKYTGRFFGQLSKEQAFREGCKSDLLDLRINIRSLRENISDIETKIQNPDEDNHLLIDELLAQF